MHGNGVACRLRHGKTGTRAMNTVKSKSTCGKLAALALVGTFACCAAAGDASQSVRTDALPVPKNVPELMKTFGGADVKTREDWV